MAPTKTDALDFFPFDEDLQAKPIKTEHAFLSDLYWSKQVQDPDNNGYGDGRAKYE